MGRTVLKSRDLQSIRLPFICCATTGMSPPATQIRSPILDPCRVAPRVLHPTRSLLLMPAGLWFREGVSSLHPARSKVHAAAGTRDRQEKTAGVEVCWLQVRPHARASPEPPDMRRLLSRCSSNRRRSYRLCKAQAGHSLLREPPDLTALRRTSAERHPPWPDH